MSNNFVRKSIVAKIMATENIITQITNDVTASFNTQLRTLQLPNWENMSDAMYNYLVSHEVSHALHTPHDEWVWALRTGRATKGFYNIIEDVRIERLMLVKFPGLHVHYLAAAQELLNQDFFGISKYQSVDKMSFINRLNVWAKTRGLLEIKFSAEEQVFVDRAYVTETFSDVVALADEIWDFVNPAAAIVEPVKLPPVMPGDLEQMLGELIEKMSETTDEHPEERVDVGLVEGPPPEPLTEEQEEDAGVVLGGKSDGTSTDVDDVVDPESDPIDETETDTLEEFERSVSLLAVCNKNDSTIPLIFSVSDEQVQHSVISYEKNKKERKKLEHYLDLGYFAKANTEVERNARHLSNQFARMKEAKRNAAGKNSQTGRLNLSKLHEYRTSENIFKQKTTFPDGQSHGSLLLIDFSGSMESTICDVLKQALVYAQFCKHSRIPFKVYGFSDMNRSWKPKDFGTYIRLDSLNLTELLSSDMDKETYSEAYKHLVMLSKSAAEFNRHSSRYEHLGGTTILDSLIGISGEVTKMREKHGLEKISLLIMTDGDDSPCSVFNLHQNAVMHFMGSKITSKSNGAKDTVIRKVVDAYDKAGVTVVNIDIRPYYALRHLNPADDKKYGDLFYKNTVVSHGPDVLAKSFSPYKHSVHLMTTKHVNRTAKTAIASDDPERVLEGMGQKQGSQKAFAKALIDIIA